MKKWIDKYDVFTKLLSVIAAIILWSYFMGIQNPTRTLEYKNISVQLTGVDELYNAYNLKLVTGAESTVDVRVSGSSSRLATLTASQIKVKADLSTLITSPGTYDVPYYVILPESGMTCVGRNPETISVTVDRMDSKEVPVSVQYTTEQSGSYLYEQPELSASSVKISGPESDLKRVSSAVISIDTEGLTETFTDNYSYKLVDKAGKKVGSNNISRSVASISVTVPVKQEKTVPLRVSLSPEESEETIRAAITPETVDIIGDPETIRDIDFIQLGVINTNAVKDGETFDFNISLPAGIRLKDGQPTTASVTISFKDTAEKIFRITDIQLDDVKEDPSAQVSLETEFLDVTIGGSQRLLDQIKSGDVFAVVELASQDLSDGQHTIGVTVTSPNGTVVIGTYSVTIRITRT